MASSHSASESHHHVTHLGRQTVKLAAKILDAQQLAHQRMLDSVNLSQVTSESGTAREELILSLQDDLLSLQEKLRAVSHENSQLKDQLIASCDENQKTGALMEQRIKEIKGYYEEERTLLQSRLEQEKKKATERYDMMVEELEKKCEKERQKYEEELAIWEVELRKVEKQGDLEKVRLEGEISSLTEKIKSLGFEVDALKQENSKEREEATNARIGLEKEVAMLNEQCSWLTKELEKKEVLVAEKEQENKELKTQLQELEEVAQIQKLKCEEKGKALQALELNIIQQQLEEEGGSERDYSGLLLSKQKMQREYEAELDELRKKETRTLLEEIEDLNMRRKLEKMRKDLNESERLLAATNTAYERDSLLWQEKVRQLSSMNCMLKQEKERLHYEYSMHLTHLQKKRPKRVKTADSRGSRAAMTARGGQVLMAVQNCDLQGPMTRTHKGLRVACLNSENIDPDQETISV